MKHFIPNQQSSSRTILRRENKSLTFISKSSYQSTIKFMGDLNRLYNFDLWKKFKESKKLPYVIGFDNLPNEIKSKVKYLVKTKPPIIKQCMLYSQFISSQIEGVNQVVGFFKLSNGKLIRELFFNKGIVVQKNTKYILGDTELIFDEKGECWGVHGWNEFNGVYFDCLNEEIYRNKKNYTFTEYRYLDNKRTVKYGIKTKNSIYENYEIISGSFSN